MACLSGLKFLCGRLNEVCHRIHRLLANIYSCYKSSNGDELLSIGSPFGKVFGLKRLGIHHELLPPGRRTSWPHAEKTEEEFVYVIEGTPDVWIDGNLHQLNPGDGVGFPPGPNRECMANPMKI